MKRGIISKAILAFTILMLLACPVYAEMGKNASGNYISPSYFDNNGKAGEIKTSSGQNEYEIYIPTEIIPGYKIHSNYNNKTDACASCHSTHTSMGVSLLQWRSVSEACFACHDGTVSTTYNVVEGDFKDQITADYYTASGGCFSRQPGGDKNISMHNVDGAVKIAAAPGGYDGNDYSGDGPIVHNGATVSWQLNFSCASCHNPHGEGGNARLLKPDVNGAAMQNELTEWEMYKVTDDGKQWSVFPDIDADGQPEKYFDNGPKSGSSSYVEDTDKPVRPYAIITSYPYNKDIIITVWNGTNKIETISPTDKQIVNSSGSTVFKFNTDISNGGNYTIKISKAYPGITVGMRIDNYLRSGEFVEYKYGINAFCGACHRDYNTAATKGDYKDVHTNKFMVLDKDKSYFLQYPSQYSYFSGSGGAKQIQSGAYSNAYRHQVGMVWDGKNKINGLKFERDTWDPTQSIQGNISGKMVVNCLTCHVAHGVSTDYWQRTVGQGEEDNAKNYFEYNEAFSPTDDKNNPDYDNEKYPLKILTNVDVSKNTDEGEISGSSVLKRLPNMGVCEACHQKGKDSVSDPDNPNHEIYN